ncbi:MAG TPA: transglycosylase domain-containing protein [Candidatus Eisenbacteria bacterium]|nr:transglycosylase domain-containing protein [Candidatus Eisenbacteria bacterium]
MVEIGGRPGRLQRCCRRIVEHFRAACDPALSARARLFRAAKGFSTLAGLALAALGAYAVLLIPFTPSISDIRKARIDRPAVLVSSDGKHLATFKPMNREWVRLNRISPHVVDALIATEDHRFYRHYGVDLWRTATGILRVFIGDPEGGSTLTQQLARNLYPDEIGRKRTITRKIKETITAIKIEYAYTKDEILETYLNTIPFLYNAFGIEMAARTYFDKPAAKLTLLESATLVAMLKGTSYYNPVLNPERALGRRNVVLSQMVKRGILARADFEKLKTQPIRLDFERQPEPLGPAPHLAMHVRKWLIDWADRNDRNIYSDGLVVHTTIDSRLQAVANRAVERQVEALQAVADVEWGTDSGRLLSTSAKAYVDARRRVQPFGYFWRTKPGLIDAFVRESPAYRRALDAGATPEAALAKLKSDREFMAKLRAEKTRLQAGFVALDPITGHVKAWVGSRDFATDQFDHVAQARRQPGSTFKPFVYAAALEHGMSPDRRFTDRAVEIPMPDGTVWRPTDASQPTGRRVTARDGLIYSKNTITAQVMQEVGPRRTAELARNMGVNRSQLDEVPALALGTSPVTLLEMVSAYATIAALGEYRQPLFITRITDRSGNVLARFETHSRRVLSQATIEHLINMLRGAVDRGTGQAVRVRFGISADVGGKTGTTQKNTDGWFILMHRRMVAGSWVGFNDARVTMRSDYWGEGAHNALPVVADFFQQALAAGLIDSAAEFPFERPYDSPWEPYLEAAREWFGGIFRDWLFGGDKAATRSPPPRDLGNEPGRDLDASAAERGTLERDRERERLRDLLRRKREERERLQD